MSSPAAWDLLLDLRARGVRLRLDGGRIHIRGELEQDDREAIRAHRDDLSRLLDAEDLAHRFVDAIRAGADLPVLATADREDIRGRLAKWDRRHEVRALRGGLE